MNTKYDDKILPRCRKLGHEINFRYCRTAENGLPCGDIAGCWKGVLDIENFLSDAYSKNEVGKISDRKMSRMDIISEQVRKAREGRK
ncbi:MAG: hypothetical protein PHO00_00625 [bacterium]|nr:hypothetical protein [bacterium]